MFYSYCPFVSTQTYTRRLEEGLLIEFEAQAPQKCDRSPISQLRDSSQHQPQIRLKRDLLHLSK